MLLGRAPQGRVSEMERGLWKASGAKERTGDDGKSGYSR